MRYFLPFVLVLIPAIDQDDYGSAAVERDSFSG